MQYDLSLVEELCSSLGLHAERRSLVELAIDAGRGAALILMNFPEDDDSLFGFVDAASHGHGHAIFAGRGPNYVELDELDLVAALHAGEVIVCESWADGLVTDRWLIHRDYNDAFKHLSVAEELRVRRFPISTEPTS